MKIVITGGDGQVAYDLKKLAAKQQILFTAPSRNELDITNSDNVQHYLTKISPDVVINTAAYTAVDRAETEKEKAFAVNAEGAKNIAIACEKINAYLLHLSTDYVFDGKSHHPYREEDPVSPLNIYGESKLKGEHFIQQYCEKYVILRVSAVFGAHGHNFVKTLLRLFNEKENINVVKDQITCPTYSYHIAEIVFRLAENPISGIFHYCGNEAVSWFDFANAILEEAQKIKPLRIREINPILAENYATLAKRPIYSVLNCEKIKKFFSIQQPDWKLGLHHVIHTLYAQ